MASTYTVKIVKVCTGGEHLTLAVYVDGKEEGKVNLARTDIIETELTWKDVIAFLLRKAVVNADATTALAQKTAIEAMQVIL